MLRCITNNNISEIHINDFFFLNLLLFAPIFYYSLCSSIVRLTLLTELSVLINLYLPNVKVALKRFNDNKLMYKFKLFIIFENIEIDIQVNKM